MDKLVAFLLGLPGFTPYLVVFSILIACGFGLPIPEDITLFAGGFIAYKGVADVYGMIAVSMFGVMLGDSAIFFLGRRYGTRLTQKKFFARTFTPERMNYVSKKLKGGGRRFIFAARFMPGLRAPVFFSCGTLGVPFRVFFFYDGLAAVLSVPAIVYSVYHFGDELERVIDVIRNVQNGILLVIALVIIVLLVKRFLKKKLQRV